MARMYSLLFACVCFLAFAPVSSAQSTPTGVPRIISYQGALRTEAGLPAADSTYAVTMRLYADASGTKAPPARPISGAIQTAERWILNREDM